jgi:hypothetical protein
VCAGTMCVDTICTGSCRQMSSIPRLPGLAHHVEHEVAVGQASRLSFWTGKMKLSQNWRELVNRVTKGGDIPQGGPDVTRPGREATRGKSR